MKPIKIKISKTIKIYGLENSLKKEIAKELTVDNPLWISNHAHHRYNRETPRYLKAYSVTKNTISVPIGYLEDVQQFLTANEIPFKIYNHRISEPCKFTFKGKLRNYQEKACKELLKHNTGVLQASTGSGKTIIALSIIATRKQKTLIIVHTKELLDQWHDRIQTFLNCDNYEIGTIGTGKFRIGRRITVALVQSVYKKVNELEKIFGQVIIDEVHRSPSRTFSEAVNGLCPKYLLGLSATPYRRDGLNKFIEWYVGKIRHEVDKKELVNKGHVLKPIIFSVPTSFMSQYDAQADYSKMLSELTQNATRNKLIVKNILFHKEDTNLILSDRKTHCQTLRDLLGQGEVLTGSTPKSEREKIVRKVNDGKIKHLFATAALISEGFDCKELNNLFLTTPIKYHGRVIQAIGRILRPAPDKKTPIVIDFMDWEIPVLMRSARSRIKLYGEVKHI